MRSKSIGCRQVDGMVSLADVIGASVHLNALQNLRNKEIGVGVAVAVGVRGQIIGHQVAADRDVLGDGFAVVARHSRGKILWSLDSARSSLDGVSRDRNRGPRAARIGVEQVLADKYLLCGVRRYYIEYIHVRGHDD